MPRLWINRHSLPSISTTSLEKIAPRRGAFRLVKSPAPIRCQPTQRRVNKEPPNRSPLHPRLGAARHPGGSRRGNPPLRRGQEHAESLISEDFPQQISPSGHTSTPPLREAHFKICGPRGLKKRYPPTKGRAGGKLPSGNAALRSPARNFSDAVRKAATNQA